MEEPKLVFDLSNIAYRSMYATNLKTSCGKPSGHVLSFTNTLLSIRRRFPHNRLVFALDSKPNRKLKLYPAYKETRKSAEYNPVGDIAKYVRLIHCEVVWCDGEEADDVIASYCKNNDTKNMIIVSSDSDLYQLLSRRVKQLNPATGEYITSDDLYKKFKLTKFNRVNLWKAIFGDSGDNVKPPIARMIKTDLVDVIESCDGTVDGFIAELNGSNIPIRARKKFDKNPEFIEALKLNYEIVTLCDDVDYLQKRYCGNLLWLCQMLREFECGSLIGHELRRLM